MNRWSLTAHVVVISQDLQDTPGRCHVLSKWLASLQTWSWPALDSASPAHSSGPALRSWWDLHFSCPGTHLGSAPTLCGIRPWSSMVAQPRDARPAGRRSPGPAPTSMMITSTCTFGRRAGRAGSAWPGPRRRCRVASRSLRKIPGRRGGHEVRAPGIP